MNAVPFQSYMGSKCASFLVALGIGVSVVGCIGIGEAFRMCLSPMEASPLVGIYHGSLVEAAAFDNSQLTADAVDTGIAQLNDGTLVGEYTVHDGAEVYKGTLAQSGPVRDRTVTFTWTDRFGHGTVDATFDSDFCTFDGHWRNDEGTMINEPWNGHR